MIEKSLFSVKITDKDRKEKSTEWSLLYPNNPGTPSSFFMLHLLVNDELKGGAYYDNVTTLFSCVSLFIRS